MPAALTPETLVYDLAAASDPQVSRDGTRLLYTRTQAKRDQKRAESQLWIRGLDGGTHHPLTTAGTKNHTGRWSRCGGAIAFVSDRGERNGIYLLHLDGGDPLPLTSHLHPIADLAWSPDGKQISYTTLFDPENPDETEPGEEAAPRVRVTSRIDYKQDGRGYLDDLRYQVWILDVHARERRMLTHDAVDHHDPQWSPDGTTIAAKVPNSNGMHAQLGLIDVASGRTTLVGPRAGVVGCWAWSPAGDRILLAADDEKTSQTDFFVYDVAAGERRRLTDDLPVLPDGGFPGVTPPSQPVWLDDRYAVVHAFRAGASGLYQVDSETGACELLHDWQGMNTHLSADDGNRFFAQAHGSLETTGQIVVYDREAGEARAVVSPNDDVLTDHPPASWERFDVERGGFTTEAWLLKPPGFDPSRRYPVVLDVHGGPHSYYGYALNPVQQALAGAGFLVVFSNPRGSGSYGRRFTQQVIGDWGGEDFLDLMAVVDAVGARPYADAERRGIYGYSYGGFMSSWTIGHTDRFRAAVIGAPVVDLVSFYGASDIGHVFGPHECGGGPDEIPDYYKERSPLTHLPQATTPTLIVHGEADERCPIGQGEQLFQALLAAGVEVEFARYAEGYHGFLRTGYPAHRADYLTRVTGWFTKHLDDRGR